MMRSISSKAKEKATRALAILFWLCAWQAASVAVSQEILLVSPVTAFFTLLRMMGTGAFYLSILNSFGRILAGFTLAMALGVGLAALSFRLHIARALIAPLMSAVKATPVASFVILALVWIRSDNLSIFISFLMVLPVIYQNVSAGLLSADQKLLEMADVFNLKTARRVRAIYAPAAFPYFLTGCQLSLGMCWKSGIAAEVIGQPANSIGDMLYRAKLFLATDELFAWTVAIIALSVLFEKAVLAVIGRLRAVYGEGTFS